ncbi:MAG TPA: glycoside hydrolase family 3 N-terminal domain-containing protein [Solirubrobacteraceae bacterium]|nr:glycoside hydrolase family 3 N-terminal domain-containing protein [Solirubrobacteraceae bacterium]
MTAVRRRRLLVLAAALVAFAIGLVAGSGGGEKERNATQPPRGTAADGGANTVVPPAGEDDAAAPEPVDGLSLRRRVGQLIVLRFAGTTAPGYVLDALREGRAAGAILFRDNVTSPEQLRALTRSLRRAGGDPVVAVDQEGGEIRILPWAPPAASAPQQQAADTVRSDARAAARELRRAGITVTLAPVGDVPTVAGAALGSRAFSDDPETAAAAMADAVRGWRAGGVAPTAKHFPGLGGATVNTDDGPATITRSRAELQAVDLPPFAAAIDAGVPLVMIGHARYPALDGNRIASQSAPILRDLLRRDLGFRGVVVTDSMEAAASLATGPVTSVSERAVRAGADLLLLTGQGSFAPVSEHLLATARESPGFRLRVRESAARVLALRAGRSDTPAP